MHWNAPLFKLVHLPLKNIPSNHVGRWAHRRSTWTGYCRFLFHSTRVPPLPAIPQPIMPTGQSDTCDDQYQSPKQPEISGHFQLPNPAIWEICGEELSTKHWLSNMSRFRDEDRTTLTATAVPGRKIKVMTAIVFIDWLSFCSRVLSLWTTKLKACKPVKAWSWTWWLLLTRLMTFLTLVSTECIRRLNEWKAPSMYSKSFSVAAMAGWGVTVLELEDFNNSLCALCIALAVAIIASEPSFKWITSFSRLWMCAKSTSYPVLDLFCCAPASSKICFVC